MDLIVSYLAGQWCDHGVISDSSHGDSCALMISDGDSSDGDSI